MVSVVLLAIAHLAAGDATRHSASPFEVTVRVVDAASFAPIEGATVELAPRIPEHLLPQPMGSDYTQPVQHVGIPIPGMPAGLGEVRFILPCPQEYAVTAWAPEYERGTYPVLLRDEDPKVVLMSLGAGGTIEGRVVGEDGKPIADAEVGIVEIHRIDLVPEPRWRCSQTCRSCWPWIARSDEKGRYAIQGVPMAMDMRVEARKSGHAPGERSPVDMRWIARVSGIDIVLPAEGRPAREDERPEDETPPEQPTRQIVRAEGPNAILTIQVMPPPRPGDEKASAGEIDPFLPPFWVDVGDVLGPYERCVRDPRGRFSMQVPPEYNEQQAYPFDGELATEVELRIPGHGPIRTRARLLEGKETVLRVPLGGKTRILGRVVRAGSGEVIPGARVTLSRGHLPRSLDWHDDYQHGFYLDESQTTTANDGSFAFDGVPESESLHYRLWARAPGCAVGWSDSIEVDGKADPPEKRIALAPEGVIRGRIRGWDRPERVLLRVRRPDSPWDWFLEEIERDRLSRGEKGIGGRTASIALGELDRDLLLLHEQWGALTSLLGPRRAPQADGTFEMRELPPGNYRLSLWIGTDLIIWSERVSLKAGEERRVLIDLDASHPIRGRLLRAGRPIGGTSVWLVDSRRTLFAPITMEAGHVGWQCRTSADGRFVLDTWPGGQTKLTIGFGDKTHGPRVALLDRFVPKGTEDVFEVELPDCAIEGEVEFQDAAPDGGRGLSEGLYEYLMGNLLGYSSAALVFAEWILFAIPEGKDFVPHLLQEEGWVTAGRLKQGPLRFRLEGMPPGTYSLRVMSVAPYHTTTVGPIEVREGQTPLGIWILVPQDPARNQSVEVWVPGGSSDGVGSRSWSLLLDPLISHILRMSGRSGLTRGRHIGIDEGQIFEVEIPTPETTHVIPAKGRGHLLVTVVDEVGEPVEGAAVSAFHRSGLDLLQFLMLTERNTDARGQLWIDSIPAETYTLQARWTNRRSNRVLIAVKAKEAQEVRLILEDGP